MRCRDSKSMALLHYVGGSIFTTSSILMHLPCEWIVYSLAHPTANQVFSLLTYIQPGLYMNNAERIWSPLTNREELESKVESWQAGSSLTDLCRPPFKAVVRCHVSSSTTNFRSCTSTMGICPMPLSIQCCASIYIRDVPSLTMKCSLCFSVPQSLPKVGTSRVILSYQRKTQRCDGTKLSRLKQDDQWELSVK